MHNWVWTERKKQIENEAEKQLYLFDPVLLQEPKEYDIYGAVEKCLAVEYDWKYITPDARILGLTAFHSGYFYVSPLPYYKEGMKPEKIYLSRGSILIDARLTETNQIGRERFTVAHEMGHQILHCEFFARQSCDYLLGYSEKNEDIDFPKSEIDQIEMEANYFAASFLMPRCVVIDQFQKLTRNFKSDYPISEDVGLKSKIFRMSEMFQVSYTAMRYRLANLGLISACSAETYQLKLPF